MSKKLYIETVGCQMNMFDSELVVAALRRRGYELVQEPAAGKNKGTGVVVSTTPRKQ